MVTEMSDIYRIMISSIFRDLVCMGIKMRNKENGVFQTCCCRLGKYFFKAFSKQQCCRV